MTQTHPHPVPEPIPAAMDLESTIWLRAVLLPLFETADNWADLQTTLGARGYRIGFCAGHLTILESETGRGLCTGSRLGAPLARLARRLGRPRIRLAAGGSTAELVV